MFNALVLFIVESGLLSDVAYVMCLDSIGSGLELFVHVSKPPKNDSAVDFLLKVCQNSWKLLLLLLRL